jgi:hypothetical protein
MKQKKTKNKKSNADTVVVACRMPLYEYNNIIKTIGNKKLSPFIRRVVHAYILIEYQRDIAIDRG